jgi:hypothetical protein
MIRRAWEALLSVLQGALIIACVLALLLIGWIFGVDPED